MTVVAGNYRRKKALCLTVLLAEQEKYDWNKETFTDWNAIDSVTISSQRMSSGVVTRPELNKLVRNRFNSVENHYMD